MLEAEFDEVALAYEEQHAASIKLSGESPDFFAEYKIADVADALDRRGIRAHRILDFGGGVGNSIAPMRKAFPNARITLLDPSSKSLEMAARRYPGQADFVPFDGERIPFGDASFDVIFVACVFHHVPAEGHVSLLAEIKRVLTPGGHLFLFEHNPLNPLTLHAVRNCPFDKNAVLIGASEMRRRIVAAGFTKSEIVYRLFFPHVLAKLRPLERYLTKLPAGAQYFILATNAAT
ncbi:MAG: class I SAM-dependent methyltransferase [Mesorhizobium sp.]